MTEPSTSPSVGIVSISVVLVGPMAGPYMAIVLCAGIGALWALAAVPTKTRRAGAMLMLRLVLTAVVLTGVLAQVFERLYGWPPDLALGLIAFAIGIGGDRWRALGAVVADLAAKRLGGRS